MIHKRAHIFFSFFSLLFFLSAPAQTGSNYEKNNSPAVTNYQTLFIVLFLLALMAAVYFFTKYITIKKEKETLDLVNQSLTTDLNVNRALMNPHFIFNSLSALQNFILTNNAAQANDHLVKFSKLIRKMLESHISNVISIELEIAMLKSYLQFREISFKEKIEHTITIDPAITAVSTHIPIMMVLPFVENALWHGLDKKSGEKNLTISYTLANNDHVLCVIDDNGIGRKKTGDRSLKKKLPSTTFIMQRLDLLNKLHNVHGSLVIEDKPFDGGTTVKIILPVFKK